MYAMPLLQLQDRFGLNAALHRQTDRHRTIAIVPALAERRADTKTAVDRGAMSGHDGHVRRNQSISQFIDFNSIDFIDLFFQQLFGHITRQRLAKRPFTSQ